MSQQRVICMFEGENTLKVRLPGDIGCVEISAGGTNGPTGYPTVLVEVVSNANVPAADGRIYEAVYTVRDDTVALVGSPGPKLLEQQRQADWFQKIIRLHDSGDHSECPGMCPVKPTKPTHEHVFEDGDLNGLCINDMDCVMTYGEYKTARA